MIKMGISMTVDKYNECLCNREEIESPPSLVASTVPEETTYALSGMQQALVYTVLGLSTPLLGAPAFVSSTLLGMGAMSGMRQLAENEVWKAMKASVIAASQQKEMGLSILCGAIAALMGVNTESPSQPLEAEIDPDEQQRVYNQWQAYVGVVRELMLPDIHRLFQQGYTYQGLQESEAIIHILAQGTSVTMVPQEGWFYSSDPVQLQLPDPRLIEIAKTLIAKRSTYPMI
jgi:hypothetical protein